MTWFADRGIPRTEAPALLLSLPDIRQATGHDCGDAATATACLLAFHGLAANGRQATATHGTDPVQIEGRLRRLGLAVVAGTMAVDDLRHYCDSKRPVICLVHWPDGEDSHWIVARGVSRGWVYYHCPEEGLGKCRLSDFELAWRAEGRLADYKSWGITAWLN